MNYANARPDSSMPLPCALRRPTGHGPLLALAQQVDLKFDRLAESLTLILLYGRACFLPAPR